MKGQKIIYLFFGKSKQMLYIFSHKHIEEIQTGTEHTKKLVIVIV